MGKALPAVRDSRRPLRADIGAIRVRCGYDLTLRQLMTDRGADISVALSTRGSSAHAGKTRNPLIRQGGRRCGNMRRDMLSDRGGARENAGDERMYHRGREAAGEDHGLNGGVSL